MCKRGHPLQRVNSGRGDENLRQSWRALTGDVGGTAPERSTVSPSCPERDSANRQNRPHWVVSNQTKLPSLSDVKPGDVLVSHPTAVREHEISIVPDAPHEVPRTRDAAIRVGRSEADAMGVDAWLSEDHMSVSSL